MLCVQRGRLLRTDDTLPPPTGRLRASSMACCSGWWKEIMVNVGLLVSVRRQTRLMMRLTVPSAVPFPGRQLNSQGKFLEAYFPRQSPSLYASMLVACTLPKLRFNTTNCVPKSPRVHDAMREDRTFPLQPRRCATAKPCRHYPFEPSSSFVSCRL